MGESKHWILVINPGSTSTKMALFQNMEKVAERVIEHDVKDLTCFEHMQDQLFFREGVIRRFLQEEKVSISTLAAVAGRGGLLHALEGGVYAVESEMLGDLRQGSYGEHASNLGAPLAHSLAQKAGCPAFIVDPVVVDELDDPARLSGHPEIARRSIFHALNQRSVARLIADQIGISYEEGRFIVAHMGGGISIGAHKMGRVVDVNNALDGEGPFTAERSGGLPSGQLVSLCFHSGKGESEIRKMIKGGGGLVAYTGSNDLRDLVQACSRLDADSTTHEWSTPPHVVFEALSRQVAQGICAHGATLEGQVDAVVLTGGMAYSKELMGRIESLCSWMAPVYVVPGEREMEALAEGAYRALEGRTPVLNYQREKPQSRSSVGQAVGSDVPA
ncbi:MAG: butyrate kinase [Spirochaetales bacterium]|nr:butyrate kinase [Spirochaetales bacterium]